MRRREIVTTRFQSLEIWKSAHATEFRVAGAVHAWHHSSRFLTGLAWDLIAAASLLSANHPPRSILMLGLAGGTAFRVLRHLLPGCNLTAIDIDPEIIALARQHMHLDDLNVEIQIADAYRWLSENKRQFDVVIDDIYLAGTNDVFRPRGWNADLLTQLRRAVAPGGLLAVNLITGRGHRSMQSLTRRILRDNFPMVRSIRSSNAQNEVLVAGEAVAAKRQLQPYEAAFDDWRDCHEWRKIEVRLLQ